MHMTIGAAKCCRLCDITAGRDSAGGLVDSPWLSSTDYAAFVSIGALVPGWTLVAPKRHVLNLALDYSNPALWRFATKAAALVEQQYGPCAVFEHGSQFHDSATSCGTAHAHLHIVPLGYSLVEKARQFDSALNWERVLASEIAERAGSQEYLFVSDGLCGDRTEGALALLEQGRSQFFRRIIATESGRPEEFDYRIYPQIDISEQSATTLLALSLDEMDKAA